MSTISPLERRARARAIVEARNNNVLYNKYKRQMPTGKIPEPAERKEDEKDDSNFFIRSLSTIGDFFGNVVSGTVKGIEGIVDAGAGIVGAVGGIFSDDFKDDVQGFIKRDYTSEYVANPLNDLFDDSYLKDGGIVESVASAIGQMLPAVAVSIATAGVGTALGKAATVTASAAQKAALATTAVSAAGSGTEAAYQDGAEYYAGLGYGTAVGAVEAGTEKLTAGFTKKLYGKGVVVDNAGKALVGKEIADIGVKRVAKGALEEGAEEIIAEAANPALKSIYKGKDAFSEYGSGEYLKSVGKAGVVGSLAGLGYSTTVGRIVGEKTGKAADIKDSLLAIENQEKKKNQLFTYDNYTEANKARISENIKGNFKNIETVLKKANDSKRAKLIKEFELSDFFEANGSMKADFAASLELNNHGKPSDLDNRYVSPGLQEKPEAVTETLESITEDLREAYMENEETSYEKAAEKIKDVKAFKGELPSTAKTAYSKLKKGLNRLNTVSGQNINLVVTESHDRFNGSLVGNTMYVGRDTLESNTWAETLIHEYTHYAEGTKEYRALVDFLSGDASLAKKTLSDLLNKSGYGFTEAKTKKILDKYNRQKTAGNTTADIDSREEIRYNRKNDFEEGAESDGTERTEQEKGSENVKSSGNSVNTGVPGRTRVENENRQKIPGTNGEKGEELRKVRIDKRHYRRLKSVPPLFDNRDYIIPQKNSELHKIQTEIVEEYGIECHVVKEIAWKNAGRQSPATSGYGRIFIVENIDSEILNTLVPHETTHTMRQLNFKPYMDFVERTPDMLNMSTTDFKDLMFDITKHIGIDPLEMNELECLRFYDELNATVYGLAKGGILNDTQYDYQWLPNAFLDFDSYVNELSEIHEQFKVAMSELRSTTNTDINDGNIRYNLKSEQSVAENEVDEEGLDSSLESEIIEELTAEEKKYLRLYNSELGAHLTANLLGTESFVDRLIRENTTIAEKILNKISDIKARLRSLANPEARAEYKKIKKAEKLYLDAVEKAGYAYVGRKIIAAIDERDEEAKFSYKGRAEDGKGIYEASFPKGTPKMAKSQKILEYISDVWSKKPIDLVITNGEKIRTISAQFDPTIDSSKNTQTDASKLAGGNRHGNHTERRVTLDLADDYYQIASEAVYNYSKEETGKNSPTHQGVKMWHYFVNDIYFAEFGKEELTPYTVTINIKEKDDGTYVYSFNAEKTKEFSTRQTLHAGVNTRKGANGELFIDSISQNSEKINTFDKKTSDEPKFSRKPNEKATKTVGEYQYTQNQYNRFGWARHCDVLTSTELDDLYSKIQAKTTLRMFKQSSAGEAIIEVNNKPHTTLDVDNVFVFVKGGKSNFEITRVVRFDVDTETEMEIIKEDLYEGRTCSDTHIAFYQEEGLAREYRRANIPTFNEYRARRSNGEDGRGTDSNNRGREEYRSGYTSASGEAGKAKIKFSLKPTKKAEMSESEYDSEMLYQNARDVLKMQSVANLSGNEFLNDDKSVLTDKQEVISFIESVLSMKDKQKIPKRRKKLGVISKSHAETIKEHTGLDVVGYEIWIDGSSILHISDRHGPNGKADQSMQDVNDIARIAEIANSADSGELLVNADGTPSLDTVYANKDQTFAKKIRLLKKEPDGIFYVVECVPDNTEKKLFVRSAYKQKNSGNGQQLNIVTKTLQQTSKTFVDGNATNSSIPQNSEKINTSDKKTSDELKFNLKSTKKVEMSEGEYQKQKANYTKEKVFSKKEVGNAILSVPRVSTLPKSVQNDIVESLWISLNSIESDTQKDNFIKLRTSKILSMLWQESENFSELPSDEIRAVENTLRVTLEKLVKAGGTPSQLSKTKAEYADTNVGKWMAKAEYEARRSKVVGALMNKAKRMRDIKFGTYLNASQFKIDIFKGSIEKLSRIDFRGDLNKNGTRNILKELSEWYNPENPIFKAAEGSKEKTNELYDDYVADLITELASREGELELNELYSLDDVMGHLIHFVESFKRIKRNGEYVEAKPIAENFIELQEEEKKVKWFGWVRKGINRWISLFGDNESVVKRMDSYEDGFFTSAFNSLREANIQAELLINEIGAQLTKFYKEHKSFVKDSANKTVEYNGVNIPLDRAMLLYMTLKRDHAIMGLAKSGFSYVDKKTDKTVHIDGFATENIYGEAEANGMAEILRDRLYEQFNGAEKEYIALAEKIFNDDCKKLKEKTDIDRKGYSNVLDGYYVPISRGPTAKDLDSSFLVEMDRVSKASFNKETVKGSKNELFIESLEYVLHRHIKGVSLYSALSPALYEYNLLYNLDVGTNPNKPKSIKVASENVWREGDNFFRKLVSDIQGIPAESTFDLPILSEIRAGFAKYQLGANPKVWASQLTSFCAASAILDVDCLIKAWGISGKDVNEYCSLAKVRNENNAAAKAQGVLDKVGKVGEVLMWPIGWVDGRVIRRLFSACQVQIQKNEGLKLGTEENKKRAGQLLKEVIIKTQQNSLATERSAAMRSGNEILKTVTMFSADAMKVFGRFIDAHGELLHLKAKRKAATDPTEIAKLDEKIKAVKKKACKSTTALLSSAIFMAAIAWAFRLLYNKDDEPKEEAKNIAVDVFGNMIGGIPIGRDIYDKLLQDYDVNNYAYTAFNDLLESVQAIFDTASAVMQGEADGKDFTALLRKVSYSAGQALGIPTRNVYNTVTGLTRRFSPSSAYWIEDKFYTKNYRSDLAKAIEDEDEDMIAMISGLMLDENVGGIDDSSARKSLNELMSSGFDVLPKSTPKTLTYEDEEITLSGREQKTFKNIYSTANESLASLVKLSQYTSATDEVKAKSVKFIYDVYYNLAVEDAIGVELENKNVLFAEAIDIEKLALIISSCKNLTADIDAGGNAVSGSRKRKIQAYVNSLRLTAAQKYMIMGYLGYKNVKGEDVVRAFIKRLNLSAKEKERLLAYSGYAA